MKRLISYLVAAFSLPVLSLAQSPQCNNSPISDLDLSRYLGTWYEIARFDHRFERGMDNVVAEYLLRDDGMIDVFNYGWKDGEYRFADGKARRPDPKTNPAQLEVSFFLFFYNDYNVMMIDDNYQVALVGSRNPKYLWILSRTPEPDPVLLQTVVDEAQKRGYDTSKLIWVDQSRNIAAQK